MEINETLLIFWTSIISLSFQSGKSPKPKAVKAAKTPRGKISPSKVPASKRKFSPVSEQDDSEEPVRKSKKKSAKQVDLNSSRSSGRAKPKIQYNYDSGDDLIALCNASEIVLLVFTTLQILWNIF